MKKIKIKVVFTIYAVVDKEGNGCATVAIEPDDDIELYGFKGKSGVAYYMDDAKHLQSFCQNEDLEYFEIEKVEEITVEVTGQ